MKNKSIIIFFTIVSVVLFACPVPVLAVEPHEDPSKSDLEYSGLELLRYFSLILDQGINKNVDSVEFLLSAIPYANLPADIKEDIDDFSKSLSGCTRLLAKIYKNLDELRFLLDQSRFSEAGLKVDEIVSGISDGYIFVETMEEAVQVVGITFNVSLERENSPLKLAHEGVVWKIGSIKSLLDLYNKLLADLLNGYVSVDNLFEIENTPIVDIIPSISRSRFPTELSLNVDPLDVFVGESITARGILMASGLPLSDRNIEIMLNGVTVASAITHSDGSYTTTIQIPFKYHSMMTIQSIYFPRETDLTTYLASLSSEVVVNVSFYDILLSIEADEIGYPGRHTTFKVSWSYLPSAPDIEREVEVVLDNVVITHKTVMSGFVEDIFIPPDFQLGPHKLTINTFATGRYAPGAIVSAIDVVQAATNLQIDLPRIALIPGQVRISGNVLSTIGALEKANIKVKLAANTAEFFSDKNGNFSGNLKTGYGFGLIGSEFVTLEIFPSEPWNSPVAYSQTVFVINGINCGVLFLLLIVVGIVIPKIFKMGMKPMSRITETVETKKPIAVPVLAQTTAIDRIPVHEGDDSPRSRIFSRYAFLLNVLQKLLRLVLLPHQTLREFVAISAKKLSFSSSFLLEFTKLVEKFLYSEEQPTDKDVDRSDYLTKQVQDSIKDENT